VTRRNEDAAATSPYRTGVVVLGSLNMDLSVTVPEIPRPGETVLGGPVTRQPGGKGANQAVAASRLGGDVHLIGRLGRDDLGDMIRSVLLDAGVDLTHVRTIDDVVSGLAFVTVDAHGENAIVVSSGANAELTPAEVELEARALQGARIAVAQLETPLDSVARFAELCEKHGVDLVLNAAPYRALPGDLLRRCSYLVLNRDEATSLTGIAVRQRTDAYEALAEAASQGAASVVITLGGDGCVGLAEGTYVELDAYQVPVVDTTGAGDAFVGAFAVALSGGSGFDDALRFAAAAGAVTCAHVGAQSLTTSDEAQQLLEQQPQVPRRTPIPDLLPTSLSADG
jgi:ribokinase